MWLEVSFFVTQNVYSPIAKGEESSIFVPEPMHVCIKGEARQ
ncbi:hypothetical protein SAMN05518847_101984 [Paenibacillus sp. OV219]|nr:hypothetical protein SAMN05518847_101984 [Paenibacillus sp. OV219]